MSTSRRAGGYRITNEMLKKVLGIKEDVTSIEYDKSRGITTVYVTGKNVPKVLEGGEAVLLRLDEQRLMKIGKIK